MEKWELAYRDYIEGLKYKDIADKYEVSVNTVKSWKSRKWNNMGEHGATKKSVQPVIDNEDLTEQQKMFCLYYLQCFNATKAYQQAYGVDYKTANANGSRLLVNASVKNELQRLKSEMQQELYADAVTLTNELLKQAMSDITDFVEFGSKEYPVTEFDEATGEEVAVVDELTGEFETFKVPYVHFKESEEVDGSLIQEVKKGKDGVSVKLVDKQKALLEVLKRLDVQGDGSGGENIVIVNAWSDGDE